MLQGEAGMGRRSWWRPAAATAFAWRPRGGCSGRPGVGGLTMCCRCGYIASSRCPVEPGVH